MSLRKKKSSLQRTCDSSKKTHSCSLKKANSSPTFRVRLDVTIDFVDTEDYDIDYYVDEISSVAARRLALYSQLRDKL
jgi:hypothetical protein